MVASGYAACRGRKAGAEHVEPVAFVSHDARLLGRMLSLPAVPLAVVFEEVPLGTPGGLGPTDYALVAVLRFDPGVVRGLAASGAFADASSTELVTVPTRPWFPADLQAKLRPLDAARAVVPGRALAPEPFLRPRYSSGSVTAVDGTDCVIVTCATS